MPISDQIRRIRLTRGWSQAELARRAGCNKSVVSRVEKGETFKPEAAILTRLADALGVAVTVLTGHDAPTLPTGAVDTTSVVLVSRPAHAGADWVWDDSGERVVVPARLAEGRRLLAATVAGDCMAPDVQRGDVVVFDSWTRHPQDGELVVASQPGETAVRWLRQTPDGPLLVANQGLSIRPNGWQIEGTVVQILRRPPRRRWSDGP